MAEGDKYLDYCNKILERKVKPWSAFVRGISRDKMAGV